MSQVKEHGISIGIKRINNEFFVKMKIVGTLTHEDYSMITPMLDNAIEGINNPKISLLVDATRFEGWSLEAVWDDLKIGLKHDGEFYKIAFVGNKSWQEYGIKISNWFTQGDMKYFESLEDAQDWISKKSEEDKPLEVLENTDTTTKEINSRKEAIESNLEFLFESNMKITGWDVPEVDDAKAAQMICDILQEKLDSIKEDVKQGKYNPK